MKNERGVEEAQAAPRQAPSSLWLVIEIRFRQRQFHCRAILEADRRVPLRRAAIYLTRHESDDVDFLAG